ncbi:MAG: hypothetical protein ACKVJG_24630 [Candidatus Latescibacterota bacterium]
MTLPDDYVASSSATYAFAYIKSERDQEGTLYLGASDGAKVWLNGEEVGSWNRTAKTPDAVAAPVALRAGYNPVLVKVYNIFGAAGLSLVAGDTLPGISYHLARSGERRRWRRIRLRPTPLHWGPTTRTRLMRVRRSPM